MSDWQTGEYIWAAVAVLLVLMCVGFTVGMMVDWMRHPQRPNKLADLKQLVGTNLTFLVIAAGCVVLGSEQYDPIVPLNINWPDQVHQLLGLVVTVVIYLGLVLSVYLSARLEGRRLYYWELCFTPLLVMVYGAFAAVAGIYTAISI